MKENAKQKSVEKYIHFFVQYKKMSKKTLKFDNIEVNKKQFYACKQPIDLNLVGINKVVISDKFKHTDKSFKYFIGYKDDNVVRPLCIILPQISRYIKYFENERQNMSFMIEDDGVLVKYNEIWNKIKKTLSIKFHSTPVYNEKYIKAKVKEFNGLVNTNFLNDEAPKEGMHYTCIACIGIDSVMKMEKKNYPQVYLEECKCKVKKKRCLSLKMLNLSQIWILND